MCRLLVCSPRNLPCAQVNYLGLQLYNLGESQALLASFQYLDSLVSWLALNDMLTLHVVHKPTKRSAKLHFLTREASQIKSMLTRYADAVLSVRFKN